MILGLVGVMGAGVAIIQRVAEVSNSSTVAWVLTFAFLSVLFVRVVCVCVCVCVCV